MWYMPRKYFNEKLSDNNLFLDDIIHIKDRVLMFDLRSCAKK
jgi:hypothetical protein